MICKTFDDLAAAVNVDSRQLRRYKKYDGAPQDLDVDAWQDFISRRKSDRPEHAGTVSGDLTLLPGNCEYDKPVAAGVLSYAGAKLREQVRGELIANATREQEYKKATGELVTAAQADRACGLVRDAQERRFERTVTQAAKAPAILALSSEVRADLIAALENAWDQCADTQ